MGQDVEFKQEQWTWEPTSLPRVGHFGGMWDGWTRTRRTLLPPLPLDAGGFGLDSAGVAARGVRGHDS